MTLESTGASIAAFAVVGLVGGIAFGFFYSRSRKPKAALAQRLEDYQLILDTLDRSNVLLWWAKVVREGAELQWTIRTPPQLKENPIYRLASLTGQGGLWKDEQAPDHERTKLVAARAIADGASGYQQEFRIIGPEGVHWMGEEVIIRAAGPNEWVLAGVVTEVTKRREAEEGHRTIEGHVQKILKAADCLLWQAEVTGDPDRGLEWKMYLPPSVLYRRIFGKDAVPGQSSLWTVDVVPDWESINKVSARALREGSPDYDQEFRVVVGGKTFRVHEHVSVTRMAMDRWSLVGVIVDVTARREAELALAAEKERLSVTLASMSEAVVTIDAEGRILFLNRAASEMTGWGLADAVGRDAFEVCVFRKGPSREIVNIPLASVLSGNLSLDVPPGSLVEDRSGQLSLVEGRLVPVADRSSRRVGAVLVLRDVTERQRMEETLRHAAKMESVGILAGGIAHDFNNILTAILSNLTLMQLNPPAGKDEAAMLDQAVRATRRASDLTLQLLTFAKGGDPVRAAVLLPEIVREAATFAQRGASVKCEFNLPIDLWAANADKGQISQVIQNLVINATQAMPGGGTLKISAGNEWIKAGTRPALAEGDYVRISVSDTGAGIPAANLQRIFDPYFTTKLQGHGLGLATVFSIIRRHQGHIEVESSVGSGSTFTFWLPAAPALRIEATPRASFEGGRIGGRILFMDDEEPILMMAGRLMARMGLDFESAVDGKEAIERYRAAKEAGQPFNVVVMDLTIPGGMGGKEAISVLKEIDPSVRAIVSSGYSSDLALSDFRKHGFRGMVAKPYDIANLASVIRSVLAEKD